ncbi:type B 50S ribosomal protein L31 [Halobacteriovorax vibrionivorans]|uniref:Large ribosomal subunit protein bL31B n=1 Tax=Halobacteriovorax vibrionivorans TaxID=2152716 RepID=A0ABY0IFH8_9BACT|nr:MULTISPECIES: type B 50S ribosomal protein L31 [Halobacteriovorax]RZF21260.1 type B 50S ribosomal protein L31 [Halobacteriovorax vibrionivorans]TGD47982.1 type B 50S ribosomal protein L31 [Halobacteriovorax sp. Y22]
MKKGIHPEYREVLFHDISADLKFITKSTIKADAELEHEGTTYPYVKLDISSASHPFYTGKTKVLDTEGRIDKFRKKFGTSYASLGKKKS